MKYSLSSRQPKSLLLQADEIRIAQNDLNQLIDLVHEMPDKEYVILVSGDLTCAQLSSLKDEIILTLCVDNLWRAQQFQEQGFKWYYKHTITSYYELNQVLALGASQAIIGSPLIFDLPNLKTFNCALRARPNLAYEPYLPAANFYCGSWIRPEDTAIYDEYITTYEFYAPGLNEEATLFLIYHDKQEWPGNLHLLFHNFHEDIDNCAVPPDLAASRIKCQQRCQRNNTCHLCEAAFHLAQTLKTP